MKKFFLSGFIVVSVAVAIAATHKETSDESRKSRGYGLYAADYYDTIPRDTSRKPRRDTVPRPDTPPRLKY